VRRFALLNTKYPILFFVVQLFRCPLLAAVR